MLLSIVYMVSMIVGVSTIISMLMQFSVMGDWLRDSKTRSAVRTGFTREMMTSGLVGVLAWTVMATIHLRSGTSFPHETIAAGVVYGGAIVWMLAMLAKVRRYRVKAH